MTPEKGTATWCRIGPVPAESLPAFSHRQTRDDLLTAARGFPTNLALLRAPFV